MFGARWSDSLGYDKPPEELINPLKRLIYICNISIQDVRNSIVGSIFINSIFGNKQLAINQVFDYLDKNG